MFLQNFHNLLLVIGVENISGCLNQSFGQAQKEILSIGDNLFEGADARSLIRHFELRGVGQRSKPGLERRFAQALDHGGCVNVAGHERLRDHRPVADNAHFQTRICPDRHRGDPR